MGHTECHSHRTLRRCGPGKSAVRKRIRVFAAVVHLKLLKLSTVEGHLEVVVSFSKLSLRCKQTLAVGLSDAENICDSASLLPIR